MPSGREIHSIKPYVVPELSKQTIEAMRAPPDRSDIYNGDGSSSDEEFTMVPEGAVPEQRSSSTRSYF